MITTTGTAKTRKKRRRNDSEIRNFTTPLSQTMRAYRRISDLPPGRRLKAVFGDVLRRINPGLSAAVDAAPFDPAWGSAAKLMRNSHLAEAVGRRDHEKLRRYFTHYWSSGTSVEFFDGFAFRFEELFLRYHAVIADHLAGLLPKLGDGPIRLVEVGSGDGKVLEWLSAQLPGIAAFYGVDLNEREIEKCRERHRDSTRLHFHAGDLHAWLLANPAPRTILVTNGGVFEYLLEHEMRALFQELRASCSPCLVAITESIADDHDLDRELHSITYGREFAFSHNYPAMLRDAGFTIEWERNRPTKPGEDSHPVRWYQILASGLDTD